ncbi:hypothetical protein, partial [Pontiella sp.]|uniref:hypothetical protein n=1 Tax=Pontiella sp. TaxID=2837462 RepID=UPI003567D1A9
TGRARQDLPYGLMLNLDFSETRDGLIPSKTLYPLHVPLGDLTIEWANYRNMLSIMDGQGLDIPHSSLLDPDGREWIVTARIFVLSDGIVLSQGNDEHGYVIYLTDHAVRATIRSGAYSMTLKEREDRGIGNYRKKWVTIELRIKPDTAILSLNRKRVAMLSLDAPFRGTDMQIRLGAPRTRPPILKNLLDVEDSGFTGAFASFKIIRQ